MLTVADCPSDKPVTLVQPIEAELALYTAEKYIAFTPSFSDLSGCNLLFKTYEMTPNTTNYIPVSELPGDMTVVSETDPETPILTEPLTIESNGKSVYFVKLSNTDFLKVQETEESDPESKRYTKMRFFYTADAFPGVETMTMILYSTSDWNLFDQQVSFDLKVGEISLS